MVNSCYLIVFLWAVLLALPLEARAAALVSIEVGKHRETITISARDVTPHKVFLLPRPDRLVIDIPSLANRPAVSLPGNYKGELLKALRLGQFDPHTSRLVFDLSQPIRVQTIYDEDEGKLVIDIISARDGESPLAEKPKAQPIRKPQKPVIVIDPGHGGQDPGTSGPSGSDEKDIVLEYAKALQAKLMKSGRYEVLLTRDDDTFIMLRKRVDIARKARASLFISLHADSDPDGSARGLSVYTVSEKASDTETAALAARENKSDVLAGMDLSDERPDVAGILISLAERETMNRSATLADVLVNALQGQIPLLTNSHRFAGFAVLKAPDIPSVLVEIGFLSHPGEEKQIRSKSYRDKVTGGIATGVDKYFSVEKRLGDN